MKRLDKLAILVTGLDPRDALLIGSIGALSYGLAQWSVPLAWTVVGVVGILLWAAPYMVRRQKGS